VVAGLTDTIGSRGLIGGQVDDLAFTPSGTSLEDVAHIHLRKTAALFRFSAWGGGVAAGLSGGHLDRLDAFGCAYGLAFQVVDDLLDEDPGECSMLHVLTRREARGHIRALLDQAACEIEAFGPDGWVLAGLARRVEGLIP
jgi:geranylgeranyl diphosphate synthase type II